MKTIIFSLVLLLSITMKSQSYLEYDRQFILDGNETFTVPKGKVWVFERMGFRCSIDSLYFPEDFLSFEKLEIRFNNYYLKEYTDAEIYIDNLIKKSNYDADNSKLGYVKFFIQLNNDYDRNIALGKPYKFTEGMTIRILTKHYFLIREYNVTKINKYGI